jgi:hypothetical protein
LTLASSRQRLAGGQVGGAAMNRDDGLCGAPLSEKQDA